MSNTVWLSGSRGFVGEYVKKSLQSSDISFFCISNTKSDNSDLIYVDYSDKEDIKKAVDKYGVPDTFIHLGWGNVYQPHDESHINENLTEGINLVDQMYELGLKRFILIGSSSEYGEQTGLLKENMPPLGEVNNYIRGKVALCNYGLREASKLNRIFIHARLFYTFGAGQKHNSLINQLFRAFKDNDIMNLSPCDQYRDYIYVSDAADGISRMVDVDESGIINLGSGNIIQLKDFVELLWNEIGGESDQLKFGEHERPDTEQSQPKSYADLTCLKNLTGWSPAYSILEGVKETVQTYNNSKE